MYWHWWVLETRDKEWTQAAEVAEQGLKVVSESSRLSFAAGYARSRKAKDLQHSDFGRAEVEARRAARHLRVARGAVEFVRMDRDHTANVPRNAGRKRLIGPLYRAMVLNYERLVQIMHSQGDNKSADFFLNQLAATLGEWGELEPGECPFSN